MNQTNKGRKKLINKCLLYIGFSLSIIAFLVSVTIAVSTNIRLRRIEKSLEGLEWLVPQEKNQNSSDKKDDVSEAIESDITYATKIVDGIEITYPKSGIVARYSEVCGELESFEIEDNLDSFNDLCNFEVIGTSYSSLNFIAKEYDSDGFCLDTISLFVPMIEGERVKKEGSFRVDYNTSKIVIEVK